MGQITTRYKGDLHCQSKIGEHSILADVSASMGGKDRAPTPAEFFIASLGMCVCTTLARYCEEVGISTEDMSVEIDYGAKDSLPQMASLMVMVIMPHATFQGDVGAIRQIAERCLPAKVLLEAVKFVFLDQEELLDAQEAEGRVVYGF
ncbi:MAG: OsmC family protein [Chloroflexi bacterium]|nr:OsmC family protein [Chloroflexota bacterium]